MFVTNGRWISTVDFKISTYISPMGVALETLRLIISSLTRSSVTNSKDNFLLVIKVWLISVHWDDFCFFKISFIFSELIGFNHESSSFFRPKSLHQFFHDCLSQSFWHKKIIIETHYLFLYWRMFIEECYEVVLKAWIIIAGMVF